MEKPIQRPAPALYEKRILALIQRAIPIEEQVRGKIDQFARDEKNRDSILKETQDLTNELRVIVDEGKRCGRQANLLG